jgi:PPP family 3-phenylpropionic acid transporter
MPYWRLSGFYLFYFASLGALLPFWGLYLQDRGFDPADIGELMAVLMATKIIAPNVWGWIADHTGRRMSIVQLASLLSVVSFTGVFFTTGYWSLALVMMLFSFFWNASLPQFEAVTLSYLGERIREYSRIRLWGSIGFILSVAGLGQFIDQLGIGLVPQVVLVLYLGILLNSLVVPERGARLPQHQQESIFMVLKRPEVLAFLVACFLMQASHSAYYAFYSIFMEQHGYSSSTIGQLWALGVIAEVMVFLIMHRLLKRWGARLVLFAQTLHAATFGTFHAAAIHLVHHYFVGRHQGRGQALYSSVSFGAGGAVGSLLSGYLWTSIGASSIYYLSAGYAGMAVLIAWRWLGLRRDVV